LFQAGGVRSINALILFEVKMVNRSFVNVAHCKYLEAMVANQNLIRKEIKRENSGNALPPTSPKSFVFLVQLRSYLIEK
jgi:hypothetical protein